jgi:hypothetical protein
MDALAVSRAMRLGKTCQIVLEGAAKTFGEFLPGGLGDLDRWFGERLQRPAFACSHARIPGPHDLAPGRVLGGQSGEFGAVDPIFMQDCVVDR